jgi:glycosyltransferase involved in cell wall biosynthesis
MQKLPKISIVTPSYHQEQYIEQTILSVIEQGYPNLEYIIIDGGSTDKSVEIIKKYEKYLSYWVSEPDKGQYEAVQKGFDRSTGQIMAWLNADDMYHKGSFAIVAEIFTIFPQIEWLTGTPTCYDEQGRTVIVNESPKYARYDYLRFEVPAFVQQESTFWKRSLWQTAGSYIDQSCTFAADFELWMRFFRTHKPFVVEALLGGFRFRQSNQKTLEGAEIYDREMRAVIRRELAMLNEKDKNRLKKIQFYQSLSEIKLFNMLFEIDKKLDLLKDYPQKIRFDTKKYNFFILPNK